LCLTCSEAALAPFSQTFAQRRQSVNAAGAVGCLFSIGEEQN